MTDWMKRAETGCAIGFAVLVVLGCIWLVVVLAFDLLLGIGIGQDALLRSQEHARTQMQSLLPNIQSAWLGGAYAEAAYLLRVCKSDYEIMGMDRTEYLDRIRPLRATIAGQDSSAELPHDLVCPEEDDILYGLCSMRARTRLRGAERTQEFKHLQAEVHAATEAREADPETLKLFRLYVEMREPRFEPEELEWLYSALPEVPMSEM